MKRTRAVLGALGTLLAMQLTLAMPVGSTSCAASGSSGAPTTSAARVTCPSGANQKAYDKLRKRLGGDLARALTSQQQLSAALYLSAANLQDLSTVITAEEKKIADLDARIALLDNQISDSQQRIDVEEQQVASLARAIYRQPDSLLVLIARTGNLHDALVAASEMVVAGQHAHAMQARLEADLAKLQADRATRQSDLATENETMSQLSISLTGLSAAINDQNDITGKLATLIAEIKSAKTSLGHQPIDVSASLADLLEQQEQDLVQRAYQAAWNQAQVGAGLAVVTRTLPAGTTLPGLVLSWPMAGATITQPFGPSDLVLEPPLGPYPHFHTGIDLAAPFGTKVSSAADGVVVAVANTSVGYGNYVIVAHGAGIMTLYGHLLETDVSVGDRVYRGQRVGLEGSSGLSTGPHLHFELRVNDQVTDPMPYLPSLHGSTTPTA